METNHQYTYVVIKQIKNEKLILKHASMYVISLRNVKSKKVFFVQIHSFQKPLYTEKKLVSNIR